MLKKRMILIIIKGFSIGVSNLMSKAFLAPPFIVLLAMLASCMGENKTADSSNGEVNLYSSRHYDTDQALYDNFTESTGIKVNLIEAGADELIARIKSEGVSSPADLLITVDAGRLWRAEQEEIFQPDHLPRCDLF